MKLAHSTIKCKRLMAYSCIGIFAYPTWSITSILQISTNRCLKQKQVDVTYPIYLLQNFGPTVSLPAQPYRSRRISPVA
jgi:hypothetical protein